MENYFEMNPETAGHMEEKLRKILGIPDTTSPMGGLEGMVIGFFAVSAIAIAAWVLLGGGFTALLIMTAGGLAMVALTSKARVTISALSAEVAQLSKQIPEASICQDDQRRDTCITLLNKLTRLRKMERTVQFVTPFIVAYFIIGFSITAIHLSKILSP